MGKLDGKRIAFLVAPEGIEQVELTEPWKAIEGEGGTPELISTESGEVQAFNHLDKADTFPVDHTVEESDVSDYAAMLVEGVVQHRDRIDQLLAEHAEGWTVARMPAVDRTLLRIGVFELLWVDEIDDPVAITEAVELARTLSTDDSPRYLNGVLGRIADIAEHLRASR